MRWTAQRKAEVLSAIAADPACELALMDHHGLSAEELDEWRRAEADAGQAGLAVYGRRPRADLVAARSHTYTCRSGLPEGTCACYACHGG